MNHQTVGYVLLCLSPPFLGGIVALNVRKYSLAGVFARLSVRLWATSCALRSAKVSFRREHERSMADLTKLETDWKDTYAGL